MSGVRRFLRASWRSLVHPIGWSEVGGVALRVLAFTMIYESRLTLAESHRKRVSPKGGQSSPGEDVLPGMAEGSIAGGESAWGR